MWHQNRCRRLFYLCCVYFVVLILVCEVFVCLGMACHMLGVLVVSDTCLLSVCHGFGLLRHLVLYTYMRSIKGSFIKDVRTEGEGALSQVWTKADKHREAFDCVRMSAFAIWLPTADFVTNAFIRCLNTNATYECDYITPCCLLAVHHVQLQSLHGGSAVGRWTCDLQVAGLIPSWSAFT